MIKNPRRKRRRKHIFRSRMPQEGLLLQLDSCHHKFNGKDEWCLISVIDDATSEIPYAEFFKGETTLACMKVLKRVIEIKGVPKAIYTDRAGWSGGQKRTEFSNFKSACEKLGIQVIFAYSPEAKGRIERSYRTFQDRLVPELRLAKIKTMEDGNKYLQNSFLKKYWNKSKVVLPFDSESAFRPLDPWVNLDLILCLVENRKIAQDHTVSYQAQRFLVKSPSCSVAGYMATFKITLEGELRVFVMGLEVQIEAVTQRQYNKEEIITFKIDDKCLYRNIAVLSSNLWGRVWDHKVTGKPIKFSKLIKKKAS